MGEFLDAGCSRTKRKKERKEPNFCLPGDYYAAHLLKLLYTYCDLDKVKKKKKNFSLIGSSAFVFDTCLFILFVLLPLNG